MPISYEENTNDPIYFQNNCLALTIRKEYQIQTKYKVFNKGLSISLKSIFVAMILTILDVLI